MNIFSSHIGFERLVNLAESCLSPAEPAQLSAHLSTCARCAAEKSWLERVIELMRTDRMEDAPPTVMARARRLFQARMAPAPVERRSIPALLCFDSLQQSLALGVRSNKPGAQHLIINAEEYDVDVRLTPAGSAWRLSGQLLGPETNGQVELQGPAGLFQTGCNELGEFDISPLPPGSYRFLLRVADLDIELPRLDIGL